MKIRIVKFTSDYAWYKSNIGDIFEVTESKKFPNFYTILIDGKFIDNVDGKFIDKRDVEIVNENKLNKVEIHEYQPHLVNIIVKEKGEIVDIQNIHVEAETAKVVHNDNVTVVILNDGSKGISRCLPTDEYDEQKGYDIAYYRAVIAQCQKELKKLTK